MSSASEFTGKQTLTSPVLTYLLYIFHYFTRPTTCIFNIPLSAACLDDHDGLLRPELYIVLLVTELMFCMQY